MNVDAQDEKGANLHYDLPSGEGDPAGEGELRGKRGGKGDCGGEEVFEEGCLLVLGVGFSGERYREMGYLDTLG